MKARNIMTPNPSVVTRDETIARAATLMRDRHVDMLPVVDDLRTRHLVGVLTDRDIIVRGVAGQRDVEQPVADLMTARPLAVVHVDTPPDEVIGLMNRRQLRRLPVLDDKERVVGVIALADLSKRARPPNAHGLNWARPTPSDRIPAAIK
jgi:CBS domain-containing protein